MLTPLELPRQTREVLAETLPLSRRMLSFQHQDPIKFAEFLLRHQALRFLSISDVISIIVSSKELSRYLPLHLDIRKRNMFVKAAAAPAENAAAVLSSVTQFWKLVDSLPLVPDHDLHAMQSFVRASRLLRSLI